MNKRLILLSSLLVLVLAVIYFLDHCEQKNETKVMQDRHFAIEDPSDIYKVTLTKRVGIPLVLEKTNGKWMVNGRREVRTHVFDNLMEGLTKVKIKSLPPESMYDKLEKDFVTFGIKVQAFNESGDRIRSYYIGGDSKGSDGTYYYNEGGERFYLMTLPAFEGSLRTRFDVEEKGWWKRRVVDYDTDEIEAVRINYPRQAVESFELTRVGPKEFEVAPLGDRPKSTRTYVNDRAVNYVKEFRKKGLLKFIDKNATNVDSILALTPFAEIEIEASGDRLQRIALIPATSDDIQGPNSRTPNQFFQFNYYVYLPEKGDLALCQHNVWQPLFRNYDYFFN